MRRSLEEKDGQLWEDALKNRLQLTETLADCDDGLAEYIVSEDQSMDSVPSIKLRESIRNVTLRGKGNKKFYTWWTRGEARIGKKILR